MRLFINDFTTIETLDTVRGYWEESEDRLEYDEPFEYFLDCAMLWNNGTLEEILTDDTPEEEMFRAVSPWKIECEDWGDDWEIEWLTELQVFKRYSYGYKVTPLPNPTEAGDLQEWECSLRE